MEYNQDFDSSWNESLGWTFLPPTLFVLGMAVVAISWIFA